MRVLWSNKAVRISALFLLSLGITASICKFDSVRQVSNETAFGLRWARQIATQGETLSLTASEKGEVDPLTWAARLLSQGTDSRILYVSKFHDEKFEQVSNDAVEHYTLDSRSGVFDYTKILYPRDGMGLRIQLFTARLGIFGAKTRLGQDFTVFVLFLVSFGLLNLLDPAIFKQAKTSKRKRGRPAKTTADPIASPEPASSLEPNPLKAIVLEWIAGAKTALTDLSIHIREMTRSAQKISAAAGESRQYVATVRGKLHEHLTLLHAAKKKQDLADLAGVAEKIFHKANPETQHLIKRLLETSIKNAELTSNLELQLESIVIDCDQAFHSLKDVAELAHTMGTEIKATTQGIMGQSQMMSELKNRGA